MRPSARSTAGYSRSHEMSWWKSGNGAGGGSGGVGTPSGPAHPGGVGVRTGQPAAAAMVPTSAASSSCSTAAGSPSRRADSWYIATIVFLYFALVSTFGTGYGIGGS